MLGLRLNRSQHSTNLNSLNPFLTLSVNNILAERAISPLNLVTPEYVIDVNNELVHPCVIYDENGWNGYKYWMTVNPLPAGQPEDEDPCMYVSNDGETWIEPPGMINPIATKTDGTFHLSDSYIVWTPAKDKMFCFYRESKLGVERLYKCESPDGVMWSAPILMLSTADTAGMMSPSFVYKNGAWIVITVKEVVPSTTYQIERRTTTDFVTFTDPTVSTITGLVSPRYVWHMEVKNYSGVLFLLSHIRSSILEQRGLYIGVSYDGGFTFSFGDAVLLDSAQVTTFDKALYKSSFIYERFNNAHTFKIWYGISGDLLAGAPYYKVALTRAILDQRTKEQMLSDNLALSIVPSLPYVFGDMFDRANSTGLGTATSGQTWEVGTGSVNVIDGDAGVVADGNHKTWINLGVSEYELEAKFESTSGSHQEYLLVSYVDGANYYRIGWNTAQAYGQKIASTGNLEVYLGGANPTFNPASYTLKLKVKGTLLSIYIDGVLKKEITLAFTSAKIGLQIVNAITKMKYLTAKI